MDRFHSQELGDWDHLSQEDSQLLRKGVHNSMLENPDIIAQPLWLREWALWGS